MPPLPADCVECGVTLTKPQLRAPAGGIRAFPRRNEGGKWDWICADCRPPDILNKAWLEKWGNTSKNGWPVDENKKRCLLKNAVGFRRTSLKDGKRVVKYVRR